MMQSKKMLMITENMNRGINFHFKNFKGIFNTGMGIDMTFTNKFIPK